MAETPAAGRPERTFRERMRRALRLRLVVPIVRSRRSPEHAARSVATGLFWAFTPTFGIQMALCCVHWWISRTFFRRDFSVVIAMAWTWVTNVFTVGPVYYVCFLIGQILLGNWNDLTGYRSFLGFLREMKSSTASGPSLVDRDLWDAFLEVVVHGWGLSTVVGSVPLAILSYLAGYQLTVRAVRRWRQRRRGRAGRRLRRRGARAGGS